MARNLAYYTDPDEEARKRAMVEEAFGPPPPPPNLGTAAAPRLPIDMTTPRRTDGSYADFHDPYQDQEPTEEELAADVAHEEAQAEQAPPWHQPEPTGPIQREGDDLAALMEDNPYAPEPPGPNLGGYASQLRRGVLSEQQLSPELSDLEKLAPPAAAPAPGAALPEKTAASLADEVQKRVLDKPESAEDPLVRKATDVASHSLDPAEPGYREKAAAAAMAAYGEDSPPSTKWEDELLRERGSDRLTDKQIRIRSAVMNAIGAIFGDDPIAGSRWAQEQRASNASFAAERDKARDRDHKNTRISRGLAAAIAQQGVPPEEAVKLKYGDDLVKAFTNGMYSQGLRAEGQALGREKAQAQHAFDLVKNGKADDQARGLAMLRALMQAGSTQARMQLLAMAAELPPEQSEKLLASLMASTIGVTPEKAAAVVKGDRSGLTPEQGRKADVAQPALEASVKDPKVRQEVLKDRVKTLANSEFKIDNDIERARALAQNDQKFALKWQGEWEEAAAPVKSALQAWKAMSPAGKEAFSQLTSSLNGKGGTFDTASAAAADLIKKYYKYAPGDQVYASRVLYALNQYVKTQSGSGVTGSEWERMARTTGMPATGIWEPFNDPNVVGDFLERAAHSMINSRNTYKRIMGGWK